MKPFLCRAGTKKDIADKLISMFPKHEIYVEPFIGGGAVFFKKEPSKYEVINDLDKGIIDTYKTIKKIKKFNFRKDLNTIKKIEDFYKQPIKTDADYLTHQKINYCNAFSGQLVDHYKTVSGIYRPSNPYSTLQNIEEYKQRLKNVKIYNQSYEKIINKFDGPDTFFYLDPPYMDAKLIYKHGTFDYEELFNILKNIKGTFLLSINDDPYIRKLFRPFYMKKILIKSKTGPNSKGIGSKGDRKELLISNYKI
jgi:DNA adenine methylase